LQAAEPSEAKCLAAETSEKSNGLTTVRKEQMRNLNFVYLSFTRKYSRSTLQNKKNNFCFVVCSLIRIFAALNINRQTMSTQMMTQQIAEYFKTQPVLKAWLFGSYSRGEQRADSDVDILILPDKSQHFSLFTLSEIYEDLKELLGREVDVITVGGLMPFARESADRDKILIYERAA